MIYATIPTTALRSARLKTDGLMASVKENFRRNLARLLVERKKSNKELAAAIGVSGSAITSWLHGRSSPELSRLEPIAKTLEVHPLDLLADEEQIKGRDLDAIIGEIAAMRGYRIVPKDD